VAGWLAEPAALGTMDFVSPNAAFSVSMALREPGWMLNDLFRSLRADNPNFDEDIDRMNRETGVRIHDLATALGGEFTFAIDGALLPLPSWKVAVEVYDPAKLQMTLERFIETFNQHATSCDDCKMQITKQDNAGRTVYTVTSKKIPYEIYYTFVDGYLLAAPEMNLLTRAIQNRATGYVLSRSEAFRSQLPTDGRMNFSALIYHNLGSAIAPMAKQLGSMNGVSQSQRASIEALAANSAPGLVYAYGKPDSIVVASQGTFFGLSLNGLALPKMAQALHAGSRGATHNSPTQ